MTEGDKLRLRAEGFDFMDITEHQNLGSIRRALPPTQLPSALPEISVADVDFGLGLSCDEGRYHDEEQYAG